jgi:hypothetical protein
MRWDGASIPAGAAVGGTDIYVSLAAVGINSIAVTPTWVAPKKSTDAVMATNIKCVGNVRTDIIADTAVVAIVHDVGLAAVGEIPIAISPTGTT